MRLTNWYVITGAPCSGKTTMIWELERLGYRVVHEVARAYIDAELKKGKRLEQIRTDELAFERHILYQKLRILENLPENETIFLDRGIPDSIAYFRLSELDSTEPYEKSLTIRYKKIFMLNRLQFEKDAVRFENEATSEALDRLIEDSYRMLEYQIVRVPLMPVKERINYILQHL